MPDESDTRTEALLAEFSELREEIRLLMEINHRQGIGGTAALGAVIGYALLSEDGFLFITLSPLVLAFMFIHTVQRANDMLLLGRHVYDIERALDVDGMGWEHRYGGVVDNDRPIRSSRFPQVNWVTIPEVLVNVVAALTYLALVAVSIWAVYESSISPIVGVPPWIVAFGLYLVLTAFAGICVLSHRRIKDGLQPEKDADNPFDDPSEGGENEAEAPESRESAG